MRLGAIIVLVALLGTARAQPAPASNAGEKHTWPEPLTTEYLIDGGAIPFVYVSVAIALLGKLASPPDPPLLFSNDEGREGPRGNRIPPYMVGIYSGALELTLILVPRDARWYHVKGWAEAYATTAALTQIAKITFGRHRPYYDPAVSTDAEGRVSFFSEHSSLMFAGSLYFSLYLHQHLFAPWRDGAFAWWEAPVYAGFAGLSTYVAYTRVEDHQHHVSDVITGAAVGSTLAAGFYVYQQSRFSGALRRWHLTPWGNGGVALSGAF